MDSRYRCQCGSECYSGDCTYCILSEVCHIISNISLSPVVYDSCIWLSVMFSCTRVRANKNNDKRGTSGGNEMELSSPPQRVSDESLCLTPVTHRPSPSQRVSGESSYVIPDTNGPYGIYNNGSITQTSSIPAFINLFNPSIKHNVYKRQ